MAAVDAPRIYDIPKVLHAEGLDAYVVRRLGLPFRDVDWTAWDDLLRRVHHPAHEVTVALVGKYVDLPDAYLSVTEALRAGGFANDARVNIRWVTSDECATPEGAAARSSATSTRSACPAGSACAASRASSARSRYAREHAHPDPRAVPGPAVHGDRVRPQRRRARRAPTRRSSTTATPHPVIATMADQRDVVAGERDMGGTMRLGLYPAKLAEGSLVREVYGAAVRRRAAPAPLRGQQRLPRAARGGRAGLLRHLAGRPAGRVRRAAPRRAPVLRRHPGAPGVPVPADPAAPAVPRPDRGGAGPADGARTSCCRTSSPPP